MMKMKMKNIMIVVAASWSHIGQNLSKLFIWNGKFCCMLIILIKAEQKQIKKTNNLETSCLLLST